MERLPMRKIKDVLRLRASGYSTRRISDSLGLGRTSTRNYLQRAAEAGLSWPDVQALDEGVLERQLFHQVASAEGHPFVMPARAGPQHGLQLALGTHLTGRRAGPLRKIPPAASADRVTLYRPRLRRTLNTHHQPGTIATLVPTSQTSPKKRFIFRLSALTGEDERSQSVDKSLIREGIDGNILRRSVRLQRRIEAPRQVMLVAGREHPGMRSQPFGRGQLMIVAVFAVSHLAGHDADPLALGQRGQDGTHAGMRDDQFRAGERFGILGRRKPGHGLEMARHISIARRGQDLGADLVRGRRTVQPPIDGAHQPVEGKLRAGGQKDHSTAPMKCGPSGRARCCHCVSHRSACRPISCPDLDSFSALAMLSIQIVRAPISLPKRSAK